MSDTRPRQHHAPTKGSQPRLQREQVIRVALELLNNVGLDGLSLRQLATKLHVQAPALYWHFKNKQELLNQMAEAMIMQQYTGQTTSKKSPEPRDWSDFLLGIGIRTRQAILSHRDGARLIVSTNDTSGRMLAGLDFIVGKLVGAGLSPRQALIATFTVINYALGFTFEEQNRPKSSMTHEGVRDLIAKQHLTHLMKAFDEFHEPLSQDEEYRASLRLIIEGVRAGLSKK
ncbi:MAG TPA: TetR/AcrR family transcriptional regulator C-terminal domain-containing protein [Candidatus Saccharimonadales bacterium]|jgi:AcrR family transcriptional regulator|nr:TetR/AcrR family transcriptional regulator C-terminal domain-containing protein [Candidatus Saccharimonadales bacterium]